MKLSMDESMAEEYKSPSQIARVLTESWFDEEMYCLNCSSDTVEKLPDNTEVEDFFCEDCEESYQLKAKSRSFGNKVVNSAYEPKVDKIKKGRSPTWAFLRYDIESYVVEDLMMIPGHFWTVDVIEKRKELSDSARRSGWVGSNILLDEFPEEAKLYVIKDGMVRERNEVREDWNRFDFMKEKTLSSKGWTNEVLKCVRELGKKEFTLEEMYDFEDRLKEIYPDNQHVQAKIRQQLQVLRDNGVLEFVDGKGTYQVKRPQK